MSYEPTEKSPEIESLLEEMSGRTTSIRTGVCIRPPIGCGKPIVGFRDPLSEHEYRISGLCQQCQDEVFGIDQ